MTDAGAKSMTSERRIVGLTLATLALVLVLVGIGRYGSVRGLVNAGEAPEVATDAMSWLLIQATAAHRLIGLTVIPVGQTVDADLDRLPQPVSGLMGLGTLGLLGVVAWRVRRRYPLVTFGLTWMLIVSAPRLIIQTPRSQFNEHQWFLGLVGAAFVLGDRVPVVVAWVGERWRRLVR